LERDREKDVKILTNAFLKNVHYHNDCEFGSIGTDCKRPFGYSDVEDSALKIIGVEPVKNGGYTESEREYVYKLLTEYMPKFIREKVRVKV
jgi:hypothetical protein